MKMFQGPPLGPRVFCAAFLSNCYTCLVGNQINTYFGSSPPDLETYLAGGTSPGTL